MKRIGMIVALFIAPMLCINAMSQEHPLFSAKVSWSHDGDSTINSAVEAQLMKDVVRPLDAALARAHGSTPVIVITGSASQSGNARTNSDVSAERSEHVRSFLLAKFPNARINAWPTGSDADARQVAISCAMIAPAASEKGPALESSSRTTVAIALAGILFFIVMSAFSWRLAHRKAPQYVPPTEQIPVSTPQAASLKVLRQEVVKVHRPSDGKSYRIPIVLKQEEGDNVPKWRNPFPGRNQCRIDREGIIKAAKAEIKQISDADLQQLLDRNEIREIPA